ncbi:hypothetical protein PHYPSEUDO_009542 [Phytophthora pseudosyringae]|uniref:Uncharacterized protein n=1 Tax=Phytophthora pseudosyringae TaxID=221518 RepID=A0A8T1WLM9_9STRA|nr:hypothetical protein PHYPSEUDO_009542 [Phytophthora pseudosyringae]
MGRVRWNSDGIDGGPSSIDVLLQWLSTAGNTARWLEPALAMDGRRTELYNEVCDLLEDNGITHRNPHSVQKKLSRMLDQFGAAENDDRMTKRKVATICPHFSEIAALLRPLRDTATKTDASSARTTRVEHFLGYRAATNAKIPRIGSKRMGSSGLHEAEPTTRVRLANHSSQPRGKEQYDERQSILEDELQTRRELYRLEIQVKRDQAICVRAKARKQLLRLGAHSTR